jgi:hypothetical protein
MPQEQSPQVASMALAYEVRTRFGGQATNSRHRPSSRHCGPAKRTVLAVQAPALLRTSPLPSWYVISGTLRTITAADRPDRARNDQT